MVVCGGFTLIAASPPGWTNHLSRVRFSPTAIEPQIEHIWGSAILFAGNEESPTITDDFSCVMRTTCLVLHTITIRSRKCPRPIADIMISLVLHR